MRVLIVDDEPIARRILREELEDMPGIEICGEASNGVEAVALSLERKPDLLLLDLQMPELGGLAVARNLSGQRLPLVIFVTAFENHALEAFETGAVDYLLKPVRPERLAAALEKARTQLAGIRHTEAPAEVEKIVGRLGQNTHLFDPAEVIAFQADGEVVYILTAKGRFFAEHSLRVLEERLAGAKFRRVHRKTLINTAHIRTIAPTTSKRWVLTMSNGLEVVVSKRLAGTVRH